MCVCVCGQGVSYGNKTDVYPDVFAALEIRGVDDTNQQWSYAIRCVCACACVWLCACVCVSCMCVAVRMCMCVCGQ